MNNNYAQEMFIKRLARIYQQNPTISIKDDTIYRELIKFNINSQGEYTPLPSENLVSIQLKLKTFFDNNPKVHTYISQNGNFWVIENRMNQTTIEFMSKMSSAIKIYVPVISKDLDYVATNLFSFMIVKGIIMQCKIAKDLRNDTLVLRVSTPRDAILVENYINNELHYHTDIRPSPFTLNRGKIGYALDGNLSYNSTIARKLILEYLQSKKESNTLEASSLSDFLTFLEQEHTNLQFRSSDSLAKYHLYNQDKYNDFTVILELIIENIKGSLTINELFRYNQVLRLQKASIPINEGQIQNRDKLLSILGKLSSIYSIEELHQRIIKYIETGNINYFTRECQIRSNVQTFFTPESMKEEIKSIGWDALVVVYQKTYEKYGYEQATMAIKKIMEEGKLNFLTNDLDRRSYLSLVIPISLLKEIIIQKTSSTEADEISNYLVNFLNKTEYSATK